MATAREAYNSARWVVAEQQLTKLLQTDPRSPELLYLLARTLFHENKAKESLEMFTRAAQQGRPSAVDFRFVALDYVLLNDYNDAETWSSRSVQEGPTDGESWYSLGRIQYTNQKFVAARKSFERALELVPRSVKAADNLGLALEAVNEPEQAMAAYRQAIDWQKDGQQLSEQPYINLGTLLTDRGDLDEALQLLHRAETIAPKDGRLHGELGKLYARRGSLAEAQTELEQAVAVLPDNAALHFQLGQVYRREGMAGRAAAELERSAALERQGRH